MGYSEPENNQPLPDQTTLVSSNSPLVTIAIPTYNRASGFLANAIECAVGQDYDNLEIIVSDNCSSDNTTELVGKFVEHSPNIVYYRHTNNIGPNNNFNFCLEKSTGVYFLMLHDDDSIDSNFISMCMSTLDQFESPGMIRTGTRIINADGGVIDSIENHMHLVKPADFVMSWFNRQSALYLCSTLFNTSALRNVGGFNSPRLLLQDAFAEVRIAANHDVANIVQTLASFRVHSGELTHAAQVIDWSEDSRQLLELICQQYPQEKNELQLAGSRFFSLLNYRRTDSIPLSLKKLSTYRSVGRYFGNSYPAYSYLTNKFIQKIAARVNRVKRA